VPLPGETGEASFQGFERAEGEAFITVGKLLIEMAGASEDMVVLASDDEEGNDFRPIEKITQGLYVPRQTWFGVFWPHPDQDTTWDARTLYERMVKDQEGCVEATLLASIDPGTKVDKMNKWGDLRADLSDIYPESIVILRHHTRADLADLPTSYSPLQEVDTAYYQPGRAMTVDVDGFDAKWPAERFSVRDEYEDDDERQFVEASLQDPGTMQAYFFWPIN